jgi:hypothetical protein
MQSSSIFPPSYGRYSNPGPGLSALFGENNNPPYSFLTTQPMNRYFPGSSPFLDTNFLSGESPFYFSDSSPFGNVTSQGQLWPRRDPEPAMLWSRGISSPCFRHDHHVIVRNSVPPFSPGNWEIDRRHMIEVQFDQYGVASHCRSTWGRLGPWRAERHRYSPEEAHSKLQTEIAMLMPRLGLNPDDRRYQTQQSCEAQMPFWANGNGYSHPTNTSRYNYTLISRLAS